MKKNKEQLKSHLLSCLLVLFLSTSWGQTSQIELQVTRNKQNVPVFIKTKKNQVITPISTTQSRSNTATALPIATHFLEENKALLQLTNPADEFKEKETIFDKQGNKHIKLQQYWNNIPIWNSQAIVHINQEGVYAFNGRYHPSPDLPVETARISKKAATKIVKKILGKEKFTLSAAFKQLLPNTDEYLPELVYFKDKSSDKFKLAWKVTFHTNDHENWLFMIDAQSGKILKKINKICSFTGPTTARAEDAHGIIQTINTYDDGSTYLLIDASKPMFDPSTTISTSLQGAIITLDNEFTDSVGITRSPFIISNNNTWTDRGAVSAHHHAGINYDYFYNTFGRNSMDGNGGNIFSLVNYNLSDNAVWNGRAMIYGYGDRNWQEGSAAKSLDVCAHEMAHGVIQYSADLVYQFQSGALNESFADIFGVMVDRDDWTIGEDLVRPERYRGGSLRNFANPNNNATIGELGWQPKHLSEFVNYPESRDNGGVHTNSGIPNHAFYLFATTRGIGKDKAEQVYYKALTQYLTPTSEFIDCREAVILAAQELYGTSAARAAATAFDQVGILGDGGTVNKEDIVNLESIRVDATYEHIGVLVDVSGDKNLNSNLIIEYRRKGTSTYQRGAQTLRAHPSLMVNGRSLARNHHAGSAMFLQPNTTYELRIALIDPDGGDIVVNGVIDTKAEMPITTSTRYYVVPGNGGGNGSSSNPFRGLQAAADRARPGATFIVKSGTYEPFSINTSGTPGRPIIFKSQHVHEAIINGSNTSRGIVNIGNFDRATEHIVIDGFSIKNGAWGINAENTAYLTIRNNEVSNVDYGFNNRREKGLENNQTIEYNSFTGRSNWPRSGARPGIDIRGNSNVVRHNTVQYFGDGISTDGRAYETSFSMDIHDNEVAHCMTDAIEVDYTVSNTRIYGNRCADSKVGISMSPIFGGPCYVFQNELLNQQTGYRAYKTNPNESGIIFGTNSLSSDPSITTTATTFANDEPTTTLPDSPLSPSLELPQLEVLPNPVKEAANIRFYLPTAPTTATFIHLFNLNGQLLREQRTASKKGWNTLSLATHDLPMGMYYVLVQTATGKLTKKILVAK